MKTNTVYVIIAVIVVLFLALYLSARAACSNDITYTPASRVDLGLIEGSKGETYTYAGNDYSSSGSAVAACMATKLNF